MTGVNLTNANFTGAVIANPDFTGATLCGANFTDAVAHETKGMGANLHGANLTRADFENSDFRNARFSGDLTTVNLKGSNLSGAVFEPGTVINPANFLCANLSGADMRGVLVRDPETGEEKPITLQVLQDMAHTYKMDVDNITYGHANPLKDPQHMALAQHEMGLNFARAALAALDVSSVHEAAQTIAGREPPPTVAPPAAQVDHGRDTVTARVLTSYDPNDTREAEEPTRFEFAEAENGQEFNGNQVRDANQTWAARVAEQESEHALA